MTNLLATVLVTILTTTNDVPRWTPQTCSDGAAETNIVVKTVLVRMMCKCGGEMKPTGTCYTSYPPQYPHVCNKCGTNATYNISYPEIRYVTE